MLRWGITGNCGSLGEGHFKQAQKVKEVACEQPPKETRKSVLDWEERVWRKNFTKRKCRVCKETKDFQTTGLGRLHAQRKRRAGES